MPPFVKKIILVLILIGLLTAGAMFGIRPLWLGYETTNHVGSVKDIRLVERPLCKYWEGTFVVGDPGKPQESFPFWVDISQKEISSVLAERSMLEGKVEIQYRRSTAYRLWLCTPHTGQMLTLVPMPKPPAPTQAPIPSLPHPQTPTAGLPSPSPTTPSVPPPEPHAPAGSPQITATSQHDSQQPTVPVESSPAPAASAQPQAAP